MIETSGNRADEPRFEVRGALLRGLIDHMVRKDGIEGVEVALAEAGLSQKEVFPSVWYRMDVFDTLVTTWARGTGESPNEVAYRTGQRIAAHSVEDLDGILCYVPLEHLVARLQTFFRTGTEAPIRVEVEDGHVHVRQDPPAGPIVCPLFHGMIDGLVDLLRVEGCLEDGGAEATACHNEGDACCAYRLQVQANPSGAAASKGSASDAPSSHAEADAAAFDPAGGTDG